ncbi:hypothetical protein AAJP84_04310 [Bartonella schoenbuchensis]|uniref:hypothetical protein n=1 Tax=Bartonella schoenbuchensis TaxID=165694 RepID=UPI0031CC9C7B
MVMRRVFNHHVCLCVLSTAILAGLALMTSQTKVYAQAQNCKGLGGSDDNENQPIVCDGGKNGTGWSSRGGPANSGEWGGLSVNRTINMNKYSGKAAVTVYNGSGGRAKIMIKDKLTVTDSKGTSNNTTAIKVERGGELALVGGVDVTGVKKGIVVEGRGSSVMVLQGTIGVRAKGGGSLIEVSNNGKVVLMKGVKVGTVSENVNGEVVINNGGTVELMGTGLSVSKGTGIKIMGTGTATVRGGGATITLQGGGTGMDVEGTASADVMDMTITGSGNTGTGVLINGSGTVTLTKVQLMQLETGARVTSGVLTLNGGSKIEVGQNGKGVWVTNGKVVMMGGSLTVKGNGKGMEVEGGIVTMMGTTVTGDGSGKGLVMSGGEVTMTSVKLMQLETGARVTNGTLTLNGTTTIEVGAGGKGLEVEGGKVVMEGKTTITVAAGGTGLNVSGGTVMMEGGSITGKGNTGTGVVINGRANVTLEGVNISQVEMGIYMEGESLMVEGGSIGFAGTYGVYVGEKVQSTSLIGVTIEGNGNNGSKGVGVFAEGKSLTVKGSTRITGVKAGIMMKGSGELKVEGGTKIEFEADGIGMYVGSAVTKAELTGVTIEGKGSGNGYGVLMMGEGTLTLDGVEMLKVATGIYAGGGEVTVKGGDDWVYEGLWGVCGGIGDKC